MKVQQIQNSRVRYIRQQEGGQDGVEVEVGMQMVEEMGGAVSKED